MYKRNFYYYFPKSHPTFEIVYLSQIVGQIEVAVAFATSDVILITMVLLIYAQYDVLFCSLKNLRYTAMLVEHTTKNQAKLKLEIIFLSSIDTMVDF